MVLTQLCWPSGRTSLALETLGQQAGAGEQLDVEREQLQSTSVGAVAVALQTEVLERAPSVSTGQIGRDHAGEAF